MIQTLVGHSLLGELSIGLVGVRDESHSPRIKYAYPLDLAPFRKVARHDLLDVVRDVYPSDVDGPVLPHEAADAAHVVAVVRVLVAPEAVDVRVEQVVDARESVEVLTVLALGADAACEEEAEVGTGDFVRACEATVLGDIAATLSVCLGQVFVFSVAAGPFVVPDVEDGTGLRRWFRCYEGGIDLRSRRTFLADDLFDLFGCRCGDLGGLRRLSFSFFRHGGRCGLLNGLKSG